VTIDRGPTFHYADIRYVATGGLEALNPSWLRISMNPALGDGGTCYGDSGGPNFLGAGANETNIVAGRTITGDFMCRATNVDYRMDTASARGHSSGSTSRCRNLPIPNALRGGARDWITVRCATARRAPLGRRIKLPRGR